MGMVSSYRSHLAALVAYITFDKSSGISKKVGQTLVNHHHFEKAHFKNILSKFQTTVEFTCSWNALLFKPSLINSILTSTLNRVCQ